MTEFKRYEVYIMFAGIISVLFLYLSLKWKNRFSIVLFCVSVSYLIFIIFFFRNPNRDITVNDNAILAPADGIVLSIEHTENARTQIYIFLSLFDVHRFRNPVSGEVLDIEYRKGKFHKAYKKEANKENEANKITFKINNGSIIYVTQIAGYIARRIVCDIKQGDFVKQGDLFGMIYFGSGCLLDIPSEYSLAVDLKSKVKAGLSVIAERK